MDDFDNVSRLVSLTGSTFEEARYAYEACGKDMTAAAVMLEKAKKKSCSESVGASGSCASYRTGSRQENDFGQLEDELKQSAQKAAKSAGGFISKLARNTVTVSGSKKYFSMPIIAAVVLLLFLWSGLVPVIIISLLFGISYTFSGPDFPKEYVFGIGKPERTSENDGVNENQASNSSYEQEYEAYENQDKGFFNDR